MEKEDSEMLLKSSNQSQKKTTKLKNGKNLLWNGERERQLENLNGLGRTSAYSELSTLWLDNGTISGELEAIVPQAIERNEWKNNEIKPKKKKKSTHTHTQKKHLLT